MLLFALSTTQFFLQPPWNVGPIILILAISSTWGKINGQNLGINLQKGQLPIKKKKKELNKLCQNERV